ncbi:MAG: ABC transporter ATP-binding protein [Eubacterium sp.]|nr:ABC transporter ATP-binding protein [Eubacterium sp.]
MNTNAIQISSLTKSYGKSRGIIDLSLSVKEGEFFGFIGPNGAGKSTTIRTLLGLITPDSGSAQVFGMDICREREKILSDLGYLPSEAVFYSGTKVRDILKLSADLRQKDCKKEAAALCDRLQLDPSRKVSELSFGNRKKLAIVCALQHMPRLLVLDEPTGGLDPLMQKEFFAILEERNKQGATIFISSHILSEIQHNCTRAAIIREGHIIACDSVDALSQTNAKRVTVHGSISLRENETFRNIEEANGTVSFLYSGEIKLLLHTLSESDITDLSISEPDLEEIFLHYYKKIASRLS